MKLNDGLTDAEKLYKSLYLQFPQVWEEPTQDRSEEHTSELQSQR